MLKFSQIFSNQFFINVYQYFNISKQALAKTFGEIEHKSSKNRGVDKEFLIYTYLHPYLHLSTPRKLHMFPYLDVCSNLAQILLKFARFRLSGPKRCLVYTYLHLSSLVYPFRPKKFFYFKSFSFDIFFHTDLGSDCLLIKTVRRPLLEN